MDTATVGILGTVGGTIVGGLIGIVGQQVKQRHDDRTRWHETRRVAYADFLARIDAWSDAILRLDGPDGWEVDPEDLAESLGPARQSFDALGFLAGDRVEEAARTLLFCGYTWVNSGKEQVSARGEGFFEARTMFRAAAKRELGID